MRRYLLLIIIIGVFAAIYLNATQPALVPISTLTKPITAFTPEELMRAEKEAKAKNKKPKTNKPDEFIKYHQLIRTRDGRPGPEYAVNYKLSELKSARAKRQKANLRTQALDWIERGPGNVPGRTRGLLVMPGDPDKNTWLAGSVGGGVWKTEDGGRTWVNKTPDFPSLATVSLAHAPLQPDIIYAGTGEAFSASAGFIPGDGIFKSTDGGETWSQLASTAGNPDFANINRLIVDPDSPDLVLACANSSGNTDDDRHGIFRSTNGGTSWTKVYDGVDQVQQLVATPGDFNLLYGTVRGVGVVKSIDAGLTWQEASNGLEPSGRLEMAVAPTNPDRLYASAEGTVSGNFSDLYLSDDAGENWNIVSEENSGNNEDFLNGQGWYDNTIAVDPYNENIVYYGGVNLWRKEIKPGTSIGEVIKVEVDELGTTSFFDVSNFGGAYFRGGMDIGDAPKNEFVSVEIRFGPGQSQLAHRFTIPEGEGSGVADEDYTYQDYVTVPFEAWDITNNRQLMASFRDQQDDGIFQLAEAHTAEGDEVNHSREYIFIHAEAYGTTAHTDIAKPGGQEFRQLYFTWPVLAEGGTWDPVSLPNSKLVVNYRVEEVVQRLSATTNLAANSYSQVVGTTSHVGVHPDHHNLIMIPMDAINKTYKILNANDGGVYVSNTSETPGLGASDWTFTGNGYNTSQFYGADKKKGSNEFIGGMQDNGTWRSPDGTDPNASTKYLAQLGGDGFEVLWNYGDTDKIIASIQFNSFWRTLDGGETWSSARSGVSGTSPFLSRLANSNTNPDVLFTVTSSGVFKSSDFGGTWEPRPITDNWGSVGSLNIEVSAADFNTVWAGSGMTSGLRLHVSTDGGETFSATNNYSGTELGTISGIVTHPTEPKTAYALFSFAQAPKILKTEDLGQTWTDISGFGAGTVSTNGFPDVTVFSLLVMPHDTNTIWAGTEIGLFESTDGGQTWHFADNGLPAVSIWQLKVVDDQVVVATHGRGIWSVTVAELPEIPVLPSIEALGTGLNGELVIDASLRSSYDSTLVLVNGVVVGKIGASETADNLINVEGFAPNDSLGVELRSYKGGFLLPSNPSSTRLFAVNEIREAYVNDFDEPTDDFIGDNFRIIFKSDFNSTAIHSTHPYDQGNGFPGGRTNYVYQLRTPIVVKAANASFSYRDVAIVETGESGTKFGDTDFYDYVVVEGTKDGINWQPIADGYDSNFDAKWLTAYNAGGDGDESMYVSHRVDLLGAFNPGDTVFFRFRLFSDPFTAGWGWIVDDLNIQDQVTGIDDDSEVGSFALYPNPVISSATLQVQLPKTETLSWQMVDLSGRTVQQRNFGLQPKGLRSYELSTQGLRPGIYIVNLQRGAERFTRKLVVK